MPSLRKRKSETKSRNSGTPKRQKSTGSRTTRSRSAGRASTPSRRSTRSPPARLQATKEEGEESEYVEHDGVKTPAPTPSGSRHQQTFFENGDYVDPDLVNEEEENGSFEGTKPEEPYVNDELLDDGDAVADASGRNESPKSKKLSFLSPMWSVVLLLLLALDIPLCRLQYQQSMKAISVQKASILEDVGNTTRCEQLVNKKVPQEALPGWTVECISLCVKAKDLMKESADTKIQARKDHPIGNIAAMILEKFNPKKPSPVKSCSAALDDLDSTNKTADILAALLALAIIFLFLNLGTSLASKGVIHPNLVTVLSVILNVTAFSMFAVTYYYYFSGDMAASTMALSKAAIYSCPTMWILMLSASYLTK